ncbi:hypothetical protein [Methylobacterium pseudosasicola]|uniref:Uncharacterized protein n=1 Tax=Methylobacterium pseudosasicola TaxID=582667 RepID=A0A1I4PYN6_9HYPH|nr:hypothetical protein [Methylobacterium pseudosasicola]SFM32864.1 hypothetical protein SAMN05192568_102734 [Methylobacterium pseudosasicola]
MAAAYGDALFAGSYYYGATGFCASFLHTAPAGIADEMIGRVRLCHGKSLRMVGERAKAIEIMEGIDPSLLDRFDQESLLVSLSLAHSGHDDGKATEVAEKLLRATKSVPYKIQACSIIIQAKPATPERRSKLIALEREARKKKCWVVANNLALALAKQSDDLEQANRYLGAVVDTGTETEDIYNVVRATVELPERSIRGGKIFHNDDHARIISAYQYLLMRIIPHLFDNCHGLLWNSFIHRGENLNLLALFRHSSFIWQVRGVAPKEDQYISMFLEILENEDAGILDSQDGGYFWARLPGHATSVGTARLPVAG